MDIHCAVCGEPWDNYHIEHEWPGWIRDNFKRGAGCESCQGERPRAVAEIAREHGESEPDADPSYRFARDVMLSGATDDPESFDYISALAVYDDSAPRPEWKPYQAEPLATCAGCKVTIVESADMPRSCPEQDRELFRHWQGGDAVHPSYHGHARAYGDSYRCEDPEPDEFRELAGESYCPGCVETCSECGAVVFKRSDLQGDIYDIGTSFPDPLQGSPFECRVLCIDCYEKVPTCAECNEHTPEDSLDENGLCESCRPECSDCESKDPLDEFGRCDDCARDVWAESETPAVCSRCKETWAAPEYLDEYGRCPDCANPDENTLPLPGFES